jgi:hypothetical protein
MVLVEDAPTAENWYSKEVVDAMAEYLKRYDLNQALASCRDSLFLPKDFVIKTHEELAEAIGKYNHLVFFYRKLEELAEKKKCSSWCINRYYWCITRYEKFTSRHKRRKKS